MPNWARTEYVFHGPEAEIKTLKNLVEYATSEAFAKTPEYVESDFGSDWLGNLACAQGKRDYINSDPRYKCRGWLYYNEEDQEDEQSLHLTTETAWSYMEDYFDVILENADPKNITYSFYCVEEGNGLFVIHNADDYTDFEDKIMVDSCIEGDSEIERRLENISGYYSNNKDLVDAMNDCFGTSLRTIEEVKDFCSVFNMDDSFESFILINEIEYV